MTVFDEIEHWLYSQGHQPPYRQLPVGGGSICDSQLFETSEGVSYFIKTKQDAPEELFKSEAAGLEAIAKTETIQTPRVYCYGRQFLILEYLPPSTPGNRYWQLFGRQLAAMHQQHKPDFGFTLDNYCGVTPQPNPIMSNGHLFFAEHRLLHQMRLAFDQQRLSSKDVTDIEALCLRLDHLIPNQPACLLHGDLWSGNAHSDSRGNPVLIDPACYWGWAEADIAMTRLFGGFPEVFYRSYLKHHPLPPGWETRMDLYNLYHLLNHLNLFGAGYYSQVTQALKRYI